jgi:hypothetical protein
VCATAADKGSVMIWSLIRRKGLDAIVRSHERDLMEAIKILKGMDAEEIAVSLLFAADLRNRYETLRDDLLDLGQLCQERHKGVPFQLSQMIQKSQSQRDWLHTSRAAQFPQVRYLAKEMWRELERGFPLLSDVLLHIEGNFGLHLDVRGAQRFFDMQGLLLHAIVHSAGVQDRDGGICAGGHNRYNRLTLVHPTGRRSWNGISVPIGLTSGFWNGTVPRSRVKRNGDGAMATIGYAPDQDLSIQEAALRASGCEVIRAEKRSGTTTAGRDELRTVLNFLRAGDVLMVTRIDRLARSIGDLQDIVREVQGIAKAKAAGVYKGRPASIDEARVRELKAQGMRPTDIARTMGIGRTIRVDGRVFIVPRWLA